MLGLLLYTEIGFSRKSSALGWQHITKLVARMEATGILFTYKLLNKTFPSEYVTIQRWKGEKDTIPSRSFSWKRVSITWDDVTVYASTLPLHHREYQRQIYSQQGIIFLVKLKTTPPPIPFIHDHHFF